VRSRQPASSVALLYQLYMGDSLTGDGEIQRETTITKLLIIRRLFYCHDERFGKL
jgi:hypothetical protein